MQKVINWFTNKRMIWFGFVGFLGFSILAQRHVWYYVDDYCTNLNIFSGDMCTPVINYFGMFLLVGATALIPSVILNFTKGKVFEYWKKTFVIYLVVYLIICVFVPWDAGDAYLKIQKDLIGIFFSVCYVIYSVFYIAYKNLTLKKGKGTLN